MQHIEYNSTPEWTRIEIIDNSQSAQLSYVYATIVNKLSDKYHFHPNKLIEWIDGLPEAAQTIFHADNINVIADVIDPGTANRYVSGNKIKTDTVQLRNVLNKLWLDKERMHIGDTMKQLSLNYPDSFKRIEDWNMRGKYIYSLDWLKEIMVNILFRGYTGVHTEHITLGDIYKNMYENKLIDSPVNQSFYISILEWLRNTYIAYNNQYETDIFKYTTIRWKPVLVINPINKELAIEVLKKLLEKRNKEVEHQATKLAGTRWRFDWYKMSFNGPRFPPSKF